MPRDLSDSRCKARGRTSSVMSGTAPFRIHYKERWLALGKALAKGDTIKGSARTLEITPSMAHGWCHHLLAAVRRALDQLAEFVEADDTFAFERWSGEWKLDRKLQRGDGATARLARVHTPPPESARYWRSGGRERHVHAYPLRPSFSQRQPDPADGRPARGLGPLTGGTSGLASRRPFNPRHRRNQIPAPKRRRAQTPAQSESDKLASLRISQVNLFTSLVWQQSFSWLNTACLVFFVVILSSISSGVAKSGDVWVGCYNSERDLYRVCSAEKIDRKEIDLYLKMCKRGGWPFYVDSPEEPKFSLGGCPSGGLLCTAEFTTAFSISYDAKAPIYCESKNYPTSEDELQAHPGIGRNALIALYHATGGPGWRVKTHWLTNEPLWKWHGVNTDEEGNIVAISLPYNYLVGRLPKELGELTHLKLLNLSYNSITGFVPPELGRLTLLERLDLKSNILTGSLPPELANLTKLQYLDFSYSYSEDPTCIPNNSIVQDWIEQIEEKMGDSNHGINDCRSENIDDDKRSGKDREREILVAFYNATGGPQWKNNMNWLSDKPIRLWYGVTLDQHGRRVVDIDLKGNGLTGKLPKELGQLLNLESIDLSENEIGGPIPLEVQNISSLRSAYFRDNRLCLPQVLEAWYRDIWKRDQLHVKLASCFEPDREVLVALYNSTDGANWTIDSNWLSGKPIGEWNGVSTDRFTGRVTSLTLYRNNLVGTLPSNIGKLTEIKKLDFSFNRLTGSLPDGMGRLTKLWELDLSYNRLTGPIPAELGRLTNLLSLYLHQNALTGSIPPSLGNLTALSTLDLSWNKLTGNIPPELGEPPLSRFLFLWLHENELSGRVPTELTDRFAFYSYGDLSLEGNDVCVSEEQAALLRRPTRDFRIPPVCDTSVSSDRAALQALFETTDGDNWAIKTNWMTNRPLEEWHGVGTNRAGRVISLNLSWNGLSGNLPPAMSTLSELWHLDLSRNALRGWLPLELQDLSSLSHLNLDQTDVCLPPALRTWLDRIAFATDVPACPVSPDRSILTALFEAMNGSKWINSENWNTEAPVETWFGVTTDRDGFVSSLDLRNNNLRGEIPSVIGNLAALRRLNLSKNHLEGYIPSSIGNLSNLRHFSLASNEELIGPLPIEMGSLTNLLTTYTDNTGFCLPLVLASWFSGIESTDSLPFCSVNRNFDRDALIALYIATGGGNWVRHSNWLSDRPISEWHGVSTDSAGRVTRLTLTGNGLVGSLPRSLANLSNLQELRLDGNRLSGLVPPRLGDLAGLVVLHLAGNDLCLPPTLASWHAGIESADTLSACEAASTDRSALVELYNATGGATWYRNDNWLSEQPISEWQGVATDTAGQVTHLNLSNNGLVGSLPGSLAELSNLKELRLDGNQLTGSIPPRLGELSSLVLLHLARNLLAGPLPAELGGLSNVRELHLDGKRSFACRRPWRTGMPASKPRMRSWRATPFPSTGPHWLHYTTRLSGTSWSRNDGWLSDQPIGEWHGVTTDRAGRVTHLSLAANGLMGSLPGSLANLSHLQELGIGGNQLTGSIPPELGRLPNLAILHLAYNRLTGSVPSELGTVVRSCAT